MPDRSLPRPLAVGLVAGSSAAVLVVELVALRLVAPYWGLTLETNTIVIGLALLAIAGGSWAGGRLADARPPAGLLAPLLGISGVVVAATPFLVRGAAVDPTLLVGAVGVALVVPGALLSAVTPVVTKLHLSSLEETGSVVGRLSGISTLGGIAGTVLTGFVLVTAVPVTGILVGLGALLTATAIAVALVVRRPAPGRLAPGRLAKGVAGVVAATAVAGGLSVLVPSGCDLETTYHCVELVPDPERDGATLLVMDGLRHSTVDLDDPAYLGFGYVRALAGVVDAAFPGREPLTAHHLGGAGLTLPRLLAAERPGTRGSVSEIDPELVREDGSILDGRDVPGLTVRVEDGRRGLARFAADAPGSLDVVVGDAFGGVSVPWHLTTREALTDVRRSLAPDGVYVLNVIDHGGLDFARAEAATLRTVFPVVTAVLPETPDLADPADFDGGNLVLVGSAEPLDPAALATALAARDADASVLAGADLDRWTGDGEVLTDDHAPVDQLLTPYPVPART